MERTGVHAGGIVKVHRTLAEGKEERALRANAKQIESLQELFLAKAKEIAKWQAVLAKVDAEDEEMLEECQQMIDMAEKERDRISMKLHQIGVQGNLLTEHFNKQHEQLTQLTEKRRQVEAASAERFLLTRRKEKEALIEEETALHADDKQKVDVAREERKNAARRVASKQQEKRELLEKVKDEYRREHEQRATAILNLKQTIEQVQADIQGKNSKRAAKLAEQQKERSEEFDQILAAGGNPYEVFRKRDQDARIARAKSRIEKRLEQSELELTQKMIQFDEYIRKKDDEEAREKAYEKQYLKSLGREIQERRVREYMKSRTIGGVDSIDPSGRAARVQASQVTTMRTHAFGLGRVQKDRADIVDLIASQPVNKSVKPNLKLIPPALRPFLPPSREAASAGNSTQLGLGTIQPADSLASNQESELQEHFPGVHHASKEQARELEDERNLVFGLPDDLSSAQQRPSSASSVSRREKKHIVRERTKLEQRMLEEARKAQLRNIVQDQIVVGRKYEGSGFISKPSSLHFEDFEVGKVYSKTVLLTNVSYTFNSFKVLELPDDVKNFFTVTYTMPGRMSAGMCCKLKVEFEPKKLEDINTKLALLAQTGHVSIPIRCSIPRVKPSLSTNQLSFGPVVVGEKKMVTFELQNSGALPTEFHVTQFTMTEQGDPTPFNEGSDLVQVSPETGTLQGYQNVRIKVTFYPKRENGEMKLEHLLRISLSNPLSEVRCLECSVHGSSTQVPIYVESPEMDFQCCVFNKLYRNKAVLRNRGTVALRAKISVPKPLRRAIEFMPDMGFVQGRTEEGDGSFDIQVKFRPDMEILQWCSENGFGDLESRLISVPVSVHVPDQVLPVSFCLRAQFTHSQIKFHPEMIDFGECYTMQSVAMPLELLNQSDLPQRFGFVKLHSVVSIEPPFGFGTLLPGDKMVENVVFSPTAAKEYEFPLVLRSDMNTTFTIPCKGKGVEPPLSMSTSWIRFGATSIGAHRCEDVVLRNNSSEVRTFHVVLPPHDLYDHGLTVTPTVGELSPGSSVRLQVTFHARQTDISNLRTAMDAEEDKANKQSAEETGEQGGVDLESVPNVVSSKKKKMLDPRVGAVSTTEEQSGEQWSSHSDWNIRCFVKGFDLALLLKVSTVCIEPQVVCDQSALDFAQVAAGQSKSLVLRIRNHGRTKAKVQVGGLNTVGSFTVVNAVRDIAPQESIALTVKFSPEGNQHYHECLEIFTRNGLLPVSLQGQGVSPKLQVIPGKMEEASEAARETTPKQVQEVHFGDVHVGEQRKAYTTLKNCSVFSLEYHIRQVEGTSLPSNFNGLDVFTITPQLGKIQAGEMRQVEFVFAPDQELLKGHRGMFNVEISNQSGKHMLELHGRCWSTPLFARVERGQIGSQHCHEDDFAFVASHKDYEIETDFDAFEDQAVPVIVGSCSQAEGGSYEFVDIPTCLAVDRPKGAVKAGTSEVVRVTLAQSSKGAIGLFTCKCILTMQNGVRRTIKLVFRKKSP